jgi:hypothetical protein
MEYSRNISGCKSAAKNQRDVMKNPLTLTNVLEELKIFVEYGLDQQIEDCYEQC